MEVGGGGGGEGLPLSTHDSEDTWGVGGKKKKKGVGKDNPNKHLEDILPSTPKLITVPWWH